MLSPLAKFRAKVQGALFDHTSELPPKANRLQSVD